MRTSGEWKDDCLAGRGNRARNLPFRNRGQGGSCWSPNGRWNVARTASKRRVKARRSLDAAIHIYVEKEKERERSFSGKKTQGNKA